MFGAVADSSQIGNSPDVVLAGALVGPQFAQDVANIKAKESLAKVLAAVENGEMQLPQGVSREQVYNTLSTTLQRHMI